MKNNFPFLRLENFLTSILKKIYCQVKSIKGKHRFSRDEIKHPQEDRTAEKVLALPAGRQGGTP
jgi:hypothetical protein